MDRPKKDKRLPEVLSLDEVKELLTQIKNVKHKTLFKLKINFFDLERNLLHVKSGKERKDRLVPLSETMIQLLKTYYMQYKPKSYVFEEQNDTNYSDVSARQVLKRALL